MQHVFDVQVVKCSGILVASDADSMQNLWFSSKPLSAAENMDCDFFRVLYNSFVWSSEDSKSSDISVSAGKHQAP